MTRAQRRQAARAWSLPRAWELAYIRDLQQIMRRVHATYQSALERAQPRRDNLAHPEIVRRARESMPWISAEQAREQQARALRGERKDTSISRTTIALEDIEQEVTRFVARDVARVSIATAQRIIRKGVQQTLPGIPDVGPRQLPRITSQALGLSAEVAAFRDANVALVENAVRVYAADVREIVSAPENVGLRVEELRDQMIARGNVSESRAALISRDQTLKLNGQVNMARQTRAGITQYVWSTSQDERVRDTHESKEGETFDWSSPPADTGHPGQDYQCRCVPLPVIPDDL